MATMHGQERLRRQIRLQCACEAYFEGIICFLRRYEVAGGARLTRSVQIRRTPPAKARAGPLHNLVHRDLQKKAGTGTMRLTSIGISLDVAMRNDVVPSRFLASTDKLPNS